MESVEEHLHCENNFRNKSVTTAEMRMDGLGHGDGAHDGDDVTS